MALSNISSEFSFLSGDFSLAVNDTFISFRSISLASQTCHVNINMCQANFKMSVYTSSQRFHILEIKLTFSWSALETKTEKTHTDMSSGDITCFTFFKTKTRLCHAQLTAMWVLPRRQLSVHRLVRRSKALFNGTAHLLSFEAFLPKNTCQLNKKDICDNTWFVFRAADWCNLYKHAAWHLHAWLQCL